MKIFSILNKAGLNQFFFLLLAMVALAWLVPSYGTDASPLPLQQIITWGVSAIFFFYGLRLSAKSLWKELTNWKLHLIIQITTFILFPLIAMLFNQFAYPKEFELWWLGIFYLAALPSTVSSSVVMISIARGNLPGGIFNASISSIIGIFITPLWMKLFIDQWSGSIDFTDVIMKLCLQVLLPLVAGVLLHAKLHQITEKYKVLLRYFDQTIILLIVYRAFSESFMNNHYQAYSFLEIGILGGAMLGFFLIMVFLMNLISSAFKFSIEDRITIIFCGSKKSLVQGAVMGQVIFANPVTLGVILLPLMIYHAVQLLTGSIIAQRYASRS